LADEAWRRRAAKDCADEAQRLDCLLATVGRVSAAPALSACSKPRTRRRCSNHLGRCGIWVRRFEAMPHRLRFGLPGTEAAFQRLRKALLAFRA
jgi:cobalamin biosynthetic protein CobC